MYTRKVEKDMANVSKNTKCNHKCNQMDVYCDTDKGKRGLKEPLLYEKNKN